MKSNIIVFPLLRLKPRDPPGQYVGDAEQRLLSPGEKVIKELQNAEGGSMTCGDLKRRFKLRTSDLRRRREKYEIVYWREGKGVFHYPQWQFTTSGALLSGVEDVLAIFHSRDHWRVMCYFLGSRQQLDGRRPLDLLRSGKVETVVMHAWRHKKQETW